MNHDPNIPASAPSVPRRKLLIRLFTRAGSAERAERLQARLLQDLAPFAPRPTEPPQPYWKQPGCFEHCFELSPADEQSFDAVRGADESGWRVVRDEESEAIWNADAGRCCLEPEVYWAQLLLIHADDDAGFNR